MSTPDSVNNNRLIMAANHMHEWEVVGVVAERERYSKSEVLRRAIRLLVEQRHPDLVERLAAARPSNLAEENLQLRAEIERLRNGGQSA